jgi:hypothetical protein
LGDGLDYDESIARAAATSGGAVFFAGSTVTIALVSLAVANHARAEHAPLVRGRARVRLASPRRCAPPATG